MEEFQIIKFEDTYYLCSEDILLDDLILFTKKNDNNFQLGRAIEIINNSKVTVEIKSNDDTPKLVKNLNKTDCYFPIIEIFNNFDNDIKIKKIKRNKISFKTICPKCNLNPRENTICVLGNNSCMKSDKKPYAYINH